MTSADLSATRTYTITITVARKSPIFVPITMELPSGCTLREIADGPIEGGEWTTSCGSVNKEQGSSEPGYSSYSTYYRLVQLEHGWVTIRLLTESSVIQGQANNLVVVLRSARGISLAKRYELWNDHFHVQGPLGKTLKPGNYVIELVNYCRTDCTRDWHYTLRVAGARSLRPSTPLLANLQLSDVNLPPFSDQQLLYSVDRPAGVVAATTVTATPQAPVTDGDVTILPLDADPITPGHQVKLPIDRKTVISVQVADPAGLASPVTYTVTVPHDAEAAPTGLSASNTADGVQLKWIAPVKDAGAITSYAVWRRHLDAGETELSLLAADSGTADTVYLDQTATVIEHRYEYQVVALRGSIVSFRSNLLQHRYEDPSDAGLRALSMNGALVSGFHADTLSYEVTVPAGTSTVSVEGLPNNTRASISVLPAPAHTSHNGYWFELDLLPAGGVPVQTAIALTVTSEDGSVTTTYTIVVTRSTTSGGFKFIEVGWTFACAIRLDGTSACWNYEVPKHADHTSHTRYGYTIVRNQPQGGVVQELTAAIARACTLRPDGETHCWGDFHDHINTPLLGGQGTLTQQSGTGPLIHFFTFGTGVKLLSVGSVVDLKSGRLPESLAAGPYQAVGTASDFTCALDLNGHIKCWERGRSLRIPYPDVEFKYLGVGGFTTCGIRKDDSTLHCWEWISNGRRYVLHENEPEGAFQMVDAGYGAIVCGVMVSGEARCWAGWNGNTSHDRFWGITLDKFARNAANLVVAPDLDTHSYTMVAMDRQSFACGLRTDSSIACWGWDNEYLASMLPPFESPWHDSPLLVDLSVDHGALLPEFDRDVSAYELSVDNATTAITITPEVTNLFASYAINADTDATVIDDTVDLSVGANVVTITVTAADGVTTRDYTVTVTRAAAN